MYFFVSLVIFLIFRPPLSLELIFSGYSAILILVSVGLVVVTNLIYYRALDRDYLSEILMFDMAQAIPVIIFSSIIFTDERNFTVLIPALIASFAVLWSHWEHHKIKIKKYTLSLLLWAITIAPAGAAISKVLLQTWNPISYEFVRAAILGIIFSAFYIKYTKGLSRKAFFYTLITTVLTAIAWILFYYSFQRSGIVYTVLVFSLQPFLVYLATLFFLKEKFHLKKAVAFGVVLLSIATAQFLQ